MRPTDLLLFLVLVLLVAAPAAAQTTEVRVIRYAGDGTTVLDTETVNVSWMESHLPVFGDGATPYLMQGAILNVTDYSDPAKWNPAEDLYVDKINDTVRGTTIRDLCDLVGGMQPGDEVKVAGADGYGVRLAYENVYAPQARQGPPFLAWWGAIKGYDYAPGLRLIFGADTSVNPYGLHVFGNQDMKETLAEKYWGWYGGRDTLPSAAQLSIRDVATVEIRPPSSGDWILALDGAVSRTVSRSFFEQALARPGFRSNYTDANGGAWEGMPLWRLVGYVDDGDAESDQAFNLTLAEQGYTIRVIAADGYNRTFTSQEVALSPDYLVANILNGTELPAQVNGRNVWPLKLVGANATGGRSIANITEIRVEGVPDVTPPPPPPPWTLRMTGYTNFTVTSGYFAAAMACGGHTDTYTDPGGVTWTGLPLWRLVGLVDDQLGHEVLIGAFNTTLAGEGYTIRVIAGDGYNRTFTSQEVNRSHGFLVASTMNGSALPVEVNGRYMWPLKLVGANATAGRSIGNITEIRLEGLPNVPAGPEVLFDGSVTLRNGTFDAFAYNSNATHSVENLTAHGALEAAARQGGFLYSASDKKWGDLGTFLLDSVSSFAANRTANTAWAYTLNGVPMNDFSADQGISVQPVADGDQLVFYFGVRGGGVGNATALVRVRVAVANEADFSLALVGAQNATVAKAGFDASPDRVSYTDASGTWSGIPLRGLVGQVDDGDPATFNDAIAARNYTVKISAVDGYNKSLNSSLLIGNSDYIVADTLNGAPLPGTMWPLRLVGALVPRWLAVGKLAEIELVGLPKVPPVGGDTGFFLVSTTPSGAEIYREFLGGTQELAGNTSAGPLNVTVYLTGTPVQKLVAKLPGYRDAVYNVGSYPAKGQTIPISLSLEPSVTPTPEAGQPYGGPHSPSTRIEAEHFDTGGEGVAYHDLEPLNLGNNGMRAGEGVDVETGNGITNVGWIRAGEYLKYSVDTTIGGQFSLTLRAANPDGTAKAVKVHLDGVPAGEVPVGGTGGWTGYGEFGASGPLTIPAGRHVLTLAFEGVSRLNLDWLALTAGAPPTTTTPAGSQPYPAPHTVPGRVEAEDYDVGGFADTTAANEGGAYRADAVDIEAGGSNHDVGWIRAGEYLQYSVDASAAGPYAITLRVANPGAAKTVTVRVNGAARTLTLPATGSFGAWRSATLPGIDLRAGRNTVRIETGSSASFNIDYLEFGAGAPATPTQQPGSAASFSASPNPVARSSGIRFTLTPTAGKTVRSAWWTFDAVNHYGTWNSRSISPTFFYPSAGTYTPLVKVTYTDGSIETVQRPGYVTVR